MLLKKENPRFAVEGDKSITRDNSNELSEQAQPMPKHVSHYLAIALSKIDKEMHSEEN